MKVAFPHMGNFYIPFGSFLRTLGVEPIIPPKPSRESIALGVRHAPEFICFPFKANLGDLIMALERGADTLISVVGSWSCRFGYYGRLHHRILKDLGYKFDSILFSNPSWVDNYRRIRGIHQSNTDTFRSISKALVVLWFKLGLVDLAERLARKVRPLEKIGGEADRVLKKMLEIIDTTDEIGKLMKLGGEIRDSFRRIEFSEANHPLRIQIVGETYMVIEPRANFDLVKRLGEMGCWVDPFLTVRKWALHPFKLAMGGERGERRARKIATQFLPHPLGGEEQPSVGYTILASRDGYDGVIHLHPFTCMPESVAFPILRKLSKEYGIPVMSLSIDEHTTEGGFMTRIEAFVDLLIQRRRKNYDNRGDIQR